MGLPWHGNVSGIEPDAEGADAEGLELGDRSLSVGQQRHGLRSRLEPASESQTPGLPRGLAPGIWSLKAVRPRSALAFKLGPDAGSLALGA